MVVQGEEEEAQMAQRSLQVDESLSAPITRVNKHPASVLFLWVLRSSVCLHRSQDRCEDLCFRRWKNPQHGRWQRSLTSCQLRLHSTTPITDILCRVYSSVRHALLRWSCRGNRQELMLILGWRLQKPSCLLISSEKNNEVLWCGRHPTAVFYILGPIMLQK